MSAAYSRKMMMEKTDKSTMKDTSPTGLRMKNRISSSDNAASPDNAMVRRSRSVAAGARNTKMRTFTAR